MGVQLNSYFNEKLINERSVNIIITLNIEPYSPVNRNKSRSHVFTLSHFLWHVNTIPVGSTLTGNLLGTFD